MQKDQFAHGFGFESYDHMLDTTITVFEENHTSWNVTKIPPGGFLTWNTSEIADDRVEIFETREQAEHYLKEVYDQSKQTH